MGVSAAAGRSARWLALLLLASCRGGYHFRPVTPVRATLAPDADIQLVEIRRGLAVCAPRDTSSADCLLGTELRLHWRAAPDTAIVSAFLAPPEAAPCTAGIGAQRVVVDDQARWDRPVALGADHVVLLSFPTDERLSSGPLVADVAVSGPSGTRCVRLPVAGEDRRTLAVAPLRAFAVAASLTTPLRLPSDASLSLAIGAGRWLGPVRLLVTGGVTASSARVSLGGAGGTDSGTNSTSGTFGAFVAPEVALFPVVGARHALGLSLAYDLGIASAPAPDGSATDASDTVQGPRASLLLMAIDPPLRGARFAPLAGRGVALSIARQSVWPGHESRGSAIVVGLGVVDMFGGGAW